MEEIAHIQCDHQPTKISKLNGVIARDYNKKQESEADGIGAAALLPWNTFFHSINDGMTADEIAGKYEVSNQLHTLEEETNLSCCRLNDSPKTFAFLEFRLLNESSDDDAHRRVYKHFAASDVRVNFQTPVDVIEQRSFHH